MKGSQENACSPVKKPSSCVHKRVDQYISVLGAIHNHSAKIEAMALERPRMNALKRRFEKAQDQCHIISYVPLLRSAESFRTTSSFLRHYVDSWEIIQLRHGDVLSETKKKAFRNSPRVTASTCFCALRNEYTYSWA